MKKAFLFIILLSFYNSLSTQDFWMPINLPDTINPLRLGQNSNNELFLATNHGVLKSIDNGLTWNPTGNLNEFLWDLAIANNDDIYIGYYNLYKSTDAGLSWQLTSQNLSILSLLVTSQYIIYRGEAGGIYKSADSGYSWDWVFQAGNEHVFTDFLEHNSNLYAASIKLSGDGSGLYRSDLSGNEWSLFALEGNYITDLELDMNNRILATSNSSLMYTPGVYRSDENGNNWANIYLENEVDAIAVDQFGEIYIGLESDLAIPWGIRYSSDSGETWVDKSSGMQECTYYNQLFISLNHYVYAISYFPYLLYRSINPVVSLNESSINDKAYVIVHPNPFKEKTNIKFNSTDYSYCKIEIYNTSGIRIQNMNQQFHFKKDEIIINLSKYSPGLYLIYIETDKFCLTKKIIKTN